jgi:Lon protease-like protein
MVLGLARGSVKGKARKDRFLFAKGMKNASLMFMMLPEKMGIMTLPNAILFPQALLPLYVFEPRYRKMVQKSLQEQRMFAVALSASGSEPHQVAGAGIIRACVDNPDGTSNLILQGVTRVRFTQFVQEEPYYIGKIEVLRTEHDKGGMETRNLAGQVVEAIRQIKANGHAVAEGIVKFLEELEDYDALADIVTYTFIQDLRTKQEILEILNLKDRLHRVIAALRVQGMDPPISML